MTIANHLALPYNTAAAHAQSQTCICGQVLFVSLFVNGTAEMGFILLTIMLVCSFAKADQDERLPNKCEGNPLYSFGHLLCPTHTAVNVEEAHFKIVLQRNTSNQTLCIKQSMVILLWCVFLFMSLPLSNLSETWDNCARVFSFLSCGDVHLFILLSDGVIWLWAT